MKSVYTLIPEGKAKKSVGMMFDWGSVGSGVVKPLGIQPFSPEKYDKGQKYKNTYQLVGETCWTDGDITEFMNMVGVRYGLVESNCRHVTKETVLGLVYFRSCSEVARPFSDKMEFLRDPRWRSFEWYGDDYGTAFRHYVRGDYPKKGEGLALPEGYQT
jgi:hypothetical protein